MAKVDLPKFKVGELYCVYDQDGEPEYMAHVLEASPSTTEVRISFFGLTRLTDRLYPSILYGHTTSPETEWWYEAHKTLISGTKAKMLISVLGL